MSAKRKKAPGSRTPGSSPDAEPRTEAGSQSSEMNGNERIFGISELTLRQQSVLPILAVSHSIAQAARDARVAESTLRRWLKDRKFREEHDLPPQGVLRPRSQSGTGRPARLYLCRRRNRPREQ